MTDDYFTPSLHPRLFVAGRYDLIHFEISRRTANIEISWSSAPPKGVMNTSTAFVIRDDGQNVNSAYEDQLL